MEEIKQKYISPTEEINKVERKQAYGRNKVDIKYAYGIKYSYGRKQPTEENMPTEENSTLKN